MSVRQRHFQGTLPQLDTHNTLCMNSFRRSTSDMQVHPIQHNIYRLRS